MKVKSHRLAGFPKAIRVLRINSQLYKIADTYFATHGTKRIKGELPDVAFESENIAVYPMDRVPKSEADTLEIAPVYEFSKGGSLAVPSGKIFVQTTPDLNFKDLAEEFEDAGYEIVQTLSYAHNAGWLGSKSGSVVDALIGLNNLLTIQGVTKAEPQMLMKAVRKA